MNLTVPFFKDETEGSPADLWNKLEALPKHDLDNTSWLHIPTSCNASFKIAHTSKYILIKFFVTDDYFASINRPINGDVHLDNCVEFFISFDQSDSYYNLEFNAFGTGKVAYGDKSGRRKLLNEDVIAKILTKVEWRNEGESFNWDILLKIPAEVFVYHKLQSFEGQNAKANFFKCGDRLPNPHYLCWNRILSALPDFHRPEYFGSIKFMPIKQAVTDEIKE
jgi:hypothetical protein